MKYSKRYIAFTIVLALVFILKFQILGVDNAQVGRFRGGELDTQVWNPMVAKEVNGQTIHAVIDNQTYNNSKSKFYMDKNRNIMVPVSMLRDALNCSAHVYDKKRLLVEKHSQSVSMDVGQKKAYLNGDEVDISSALKEVRGQLVVSLEDLSNLLGYSCSFDIASNTITASDKDTSAIVPASYDLRERDRVSTIYNQGYYGTCWAFAAYATLETQLLKAGKGEWDFSEKKQWICSPKPALMSILWKSAARPSRQESLSDRIPRARPRRKRAPTSPYR